MDLAILIRGQSNAWLFSDYGAAEAVRAHAETLLGFDRLHDHVRLLGGPNQTERGASALLRATPIAPAWIEHGRPGPEEQHLLDMLHSLSPNSRATPTLTLWMHNESDSADPRLTTADWIAAVRRDAQWVRATLGQSPTTTPYLFVWIPFDFGGGKAATALVDAGATKIRAGMAALAADPAFNARLAPQTGDLDMDGLGLFCGGLHMSRADSRVLVERLARAVADAFRAYSKQGSPEAAGPLAAGPAAVAATLADPAAGRIDVALAVPDRLAPLSAAAAAGAGWVWHGDNGAVRVPSRVTVAGDRLALAFGPHLTPPGHLFYGWGHGRIAIGDGCGRAAAIADTDGLALTAPLAGLDVHG